MGTTGTEAVAASSTARRLLRGVSLYGVALLAPRVVRLLTVPLIVHAISLRVFGTFALLSLLVPIANTACELGMGTAALRLAPDDRQAAPRTFSSLVYGRSILAGLLLLATILSRRFLSRVLTGTEDHADLVPLVGASVVAITLSEAFSDQLRFEQRHRTLAATLVARTLLVNGVMAFLVVARGWGLRGLIVGSLVGNGLVLVVLAWTCRSSLRIAPSARRFAALLRLGAPMAVLLVLVNLREFDRFLIEVRGSIEDVGGYALAMRIVGPIALGNVALGLVLEPHLFRTFRDDRAASIIGVFFRTYVAVFSTVAIAVAALAPEVFRLIAPASWSFAARAAPTLLFAFVADGVLRVAGIGADLSKRTGLWALAGIVQLAVAFALGWLLVPRIGILGASIGLFGGTLAATVVAARLARIVYPLPLPIARSLVVLVLGAVLGTFLVGAASHAPASLPLRLAAIPLFALVAHRLSGLKVKDVREALRA
jgi:O-antigen/teichoic acid export membrane protein